MSERHLSPTATEAGQNLVSNGSTVPGVLRVHVTGSSGLVGRRLCLSLQDNGHEVRRLVRRKDETGPRALLWNPAGDQVDQAVLEGADVVVHLAGENIADKRWSDKQKRVIRESRTTSTANLARTIAAMENPPATFVCASAIGFYGSRGDEQLDESSEPGEGFLADVCKGWENACEPARQAGVRVVNVRTGMVLSGDGGALAKMLTPFRMGVGGVLGSGKQYMSWIEVDDLVRLIVFSMTATSLKGPVNAVAPKPVTNKEFTKTLGRVLGRPTIMPMPAFAARLAFGEMADELLLSSARVYPKQAEESGFRFLHADLESALRHTLDK